MAASRRSTGASACSARFTKSRVRRSSRWKPNDTSIAMSATAKARPGLCGDSRDIRGGEEGDRNQPKVQRPQPLVGVEDHPRPRVLERNVEQFTLLTRARASSDRPRVFAIADRPHRLERIGCVGPLPVRLLPLSREETIRRSTRRRGVAPFAPTGSDAGREPDDGRSDLVRTSSLRREPLLDATACLAGRTQVGG